MEIIRPKEEEGLTMLYEAAMLGCATTLNSLIHKDRLILHKVSLTSFTETPLHISAFLGHLDFTTAILAKRPNMASDCDSSKLYPLHLASAEGHTEIVKALLLAKSDVCMASDQDGRIPLHLAAMRGRVEVIQELVSACPESISEFLDGDTVLHLCVKYNHLEALKILVSMVKEDELFKGDQDGNTILHLSVMLKQLETIKYLLQVPEIKERANTFNSYGFTAMDVFEQCPKDFKSLKILNILMEAGARRALELNINNFPSQQTTVVSTNNETTPAATAQVSSSSSKAKSWFWKLFNYLNCDTEQIRGSLMIIATVIATMTFQAAINPPGGVWQQDFTNSLGGYNCGEVNVCQAGTAVLAYAYPKLHIAFLTWNSISFAASLSVIALILSGFPLNKRLSLLSLTPVMGCTVTLLISTYITGMIMVTPSSIADKVWNMEWKLFCFMLGISAVGVVIGFIRLAGRIAKKLHKYWPKLLDKIRKRQLIRSSSEEPVI